MMKWILVCLPALSLMADDLTVETKRLHLGKAGQFEWDVYKDQAVDAERLERKFEAKANATEQTLRLWQRDVKLTWPVLLNGRKLGKLVTAETAMESLLAIPTGTLREGENVLVIEAPAGLDDIEVGPVFIAAKPMVEVMSGSQMEVMVTDGETGAGLPCRLTLTRKDGTLQPLWAEPAAEVAVRIGVVYTRHGKATLSLPPGDYILHAGRGFEWSAGRAEITVRAGETKQVALQLRREVPTVGWIAADSHIHTLTHSGHGDAKIEERMLTIAGEGIELAIATDHNHHTDYAPSAASMGVAQRFTPVIGNEVTTKHGHFNAFPIEPGARVVNHQQEDWAKLIPEIRATPGVKVITLNHPRDLHSGFIPLGGMQFNPKTGRHRQADALDIDAMEVVTSAAMQSDIHLLYRDWFALLNRGHRIAAIASSDSHDVNRFIVGQGRTYVAAKDGDVANLDLDEVWRSYKEGRLLVSLGLLAQVKVNDKFTVGDLATGLAESIKVEATVYGPAWTQADRIELFANGILIREQKIEHDHRAGEKARIVWQIPKPAHDVHLVVIATGPGITEPFWEIPRPYQPTSKTFVPRVVGSTNPIWLDANGDGRFEPAVAIAQRLLQASGGDRAKLQEALKNCDEAVAVQVESLMAKSDQ
ncbi:CehA/McbA family metallohydrolase [Prosthecobacter sp.]|uniref:CehA/McbA family metallohydrolase n=1 Tax=Prosthecobacter sp. TaxID=1965333 RepID=UPI00248A6984|nr:CehA/McbA family metallohydrolase [Prosthecobacter sp.]MDI1311891.1 CehA/McbA family metallohydrolase [Prosthecobacter sp.]